MNTGLNINAFGEITFQNDGKPFTGFPSRKVEALLVYWQVKISVQRSESLFTLLWPGMPKKSARHNLRQIFPEAAS